MSESLKRELNKTYLIFQSDGTGYKETYEIEMLLKNSLQWILPLHVLRLDGQIQMYYDVSLKQNLRDCAERVKLSFQTICALFEMLNVLQKELRGYLLDIEHIVLDMEHIYTKEGSFFVCYCPWERKDVRESFRKLLEEILGCLDYEDTKGVALAYHLYQNICKGDCSIDEILKEHKTIKNEEAEKNDVETVMLVQNETKQKEKEDTKDPKEGREKKKSGIIRKLINFFLKKEVLEKRMQEETLAHEEECRELFSEELFTAKKTISETYESNTILLDSMPAGCWKLRPIDQRYEEFTVSENMFLVGKRKESVDGCIQRDTISRIHSRMYVKNGRLYISDANSTNGTFVNGVQLEAGEEMEILKGDSILFADVEYECYNSL